MKRLLLLALVFAPLVSCPAKEPALRVYRWDDVGHMAYVGLRDHSAFYRIDRQSGEVWICKGEVVEAWAGAVDEIDPPYEPACAGLDGTIFPAPVIATPRFGGGSHNPPTTQWTTLSHDPSPRTLTFCGMFRRATKERQRLVCAAAGVLSEQACRDLCLQERTK